MAIYHCSVKIIGRGSGRSSVASAAYRSGTKIVNEYDGIAHDYDNRNTVASAAYRSGGKLNEQNNTYDFTNKKGVVYSEIILPENAPREFLDRGTLWNAVEKIEKQKNAQTAREVEIALPNELNREQQIELVQEYVRENFVNEGMCVDFSIHSGHKHKNAPGMTFDSPIKKDNPHAHIMLTVRPLNEDGTWGDKSKKEYIRDRYGNRIKTERGEWKSRKIEATNWNDKKTLLKWRESWADITNHHLERSSSLERIDHRTLKAQGIDREPTIHEGVQSRQMEKRGIRTGKGEFNREIRQRNQPKINYLGERINNRLFETGFNPQQFENEVKINNAEMKKIERYINQLETDKEFLIEYNRKISDLYKQRANSDHKHTEEIDEKIQLLNRARTQAISQIEREMEQINQLSIEKTTNEIQKMTLRFTQEPTQTRGIVKEITREITHGR